MTTSRRNDRLAEHCARCEGSMNMRARMQTSEDGVFISALDLWSLLLFAFLALAFLVRHGQEGPSELQLPLVGAHRSAGREDTRVVFVSWAGDVDVRGSKGALCTVSVREGSWKSTESTTTVPCWPGAFEGGQKLPLSDRLRLAADQKLRAVVVCPPAKVSLEACARLAYLLYEHRFEVVASYVDGSI